MQVKELEQIETPDCKKQEISGRIQDSDALEERCDKKDFKVESVVDVSGKTLDFPLINGEERMVEEVYVYKNELNLIPTAMGRLKNLKTLKFFSNAVNLFPREFGNLVELECLQVKVSEPGINGLEVSKLTNLKELELSRVPPRLSAFPRLSDIAGLKCLTRLSVCHFSIRYLPPEIGCLNNLEYLDLSFNKMRNLPDEITSLNLLIQLKVTNNKLIDLPLRLSCLQRLELLDLSNNWLTSLKYSELESMHNLRILNLQHNQLRRCQIPSWICCNLGGNVSDLSNDEPADMDVYDGVIQEIHGSCVAPLSNLSGLSPNNRSLAARRGDGWKRRYNLQTKARQERLNYCRKLKVDASSERSSEKCMTCRVSGHSDNASSKDLSVVPEEKLNNEDLSPECEVQGNSVTGPGGEDFGPVKESVNACSCSAIDSDGKHKEIGSSAALALFLMLLTYWIEAHIPSILIVYRSQKGIPRRILIIPSPPNPADQPMILLTCHAYIVKDRFVELQIIYPMVSMMRDEIVPLCHWVAMRKNCMLTCGK
ncbi:UNVERIFIED_CONTAM: hypothetical protein Sangu_2785900 [Sesamum angustifolium]|uniref:Disease resistance R13L4/SHOC-2-like LRR domain-containing protein n=1 Tax=Sesamum angustifolium TaxID=2727405 RepID=A0AAW2IT04_9LAMI